MASFRILHMYPELMNLYGDRGNLLCLQKRIEWYGHRCIIEKQGLDNRTDFASVDMVFMGGGSDREQGLVYRDLLEKAATLLEHIENGLPVLCICGAYQLLGNSYIDFDGRSMSGLAFFPFYTRAGSKRLIGNVIISSQINGIDETVVGFENHGGRTYFEDPFLKPFGRVIKGFGNNGEDGSEGIVYKNLIGTYLHGPLLPKNPGVADFFIEAMFARQGLKMEKYLDDSIENTAHQQVINKIMNSK
ncbi:type 1 glutamine amidotransferase [Syntrophomonas palmitatica]|uniref:type 1 glutamine amidotransferase n=1 Tax=Syntrophomonas palmitatica TaxID=402877 RepID=UPI0006D24530|nr:hypothetical protein [Syntrophomonas palmitatica]